MCISKKLSELPHAARLGLTFTVTGSSYLCIGLSLMSFSAIYNQVYPQLVSYTSPAAAAWIWGCIAALKHVGRLLGAVLLAPMTDHLGRIDSVFLSICGLILGMFCQSLASFSIALLAVGGLIQGASGAVLHNSVTIFVRETAPTNLRFTFLGVNSVMESMGLFTETVLGLPMILSNEKYWVYMLIVPMISAIPAMLLANFLPDTPAQLQKNGKFHAAKESLYFYRNDDDLSLIDLSADNSERQNVIQFMRSKESRFGLIVIALFAIADSAAGLAVLFVYLVPIGTMLHCFDAGKIAVIGTAIMIPFPYISGHFSDKVGRLTILKTCYTVIGCVQIIASAVRFARFSINLWPAGTLIIIWLMVYICSGDTLRMSINELLPYRCRSAGMSFRVVCLNISGIFVSQVFLPLENYVPGCGFLFLALMLLCASIPGFILLPETRALSPEVIQEQVVQKFPIFGHNDYGATSSSSSSSAKE